jgi:UDP-N-acetylmuramoylalanine--D-glutamate ligase
MIQLKNRRLALLGLGLENRAVGDFLHAQSIPFSICDSKAEYDKKGNDKAINDKVVNDKADNNKVPWEQRWPGSIVGWRLGPDYLDGLADFDLVCRTPGLPYLHPALVQARQSGVACTSQTHLFLERCPAPTVGVTGTKGKGTTATLLAAMLATSSARVHLGGNIGTPPLSFLDQIDAQDRVVLELSSFQLQDLELSPKVAILLSITQDHLDHHANREEYVKAKSSLCLYQRPEDHLVFNADCPTASTLAQKSPAHLWPYGNGTPTKTGAWLSDDTLWLCRPNNKAESVCRLDQIPLPGRHNAENAAAACAAAAACGSATSQIRQALSQARPLAHRLETVATYDGIRYINDSLATTPDAAAAAIAAFEAPTLLIAGGSSKGADFSDLAQRAAAIPLKGIFLIGQEAIRLQAALQAATYPADRLHRCTNLAEALRQAQQKAQAGDVVLLSPACASFDMFSGYRQRGESFQALVNSSS